MNRTEPMQQELHDEGGSNDVCEPTVLCSRERQRSYTKLPDAPETLHLGRIHQHRNDFLLVRFEGNEAVHRITQNQWAFPFRAGASMASEF